MKKMIAMILTIALMAVASVGLFGCTPRSQKLRISNWGEYMDRDILSEFETWYKNTTGEKVKVEYSEFETNETLIMKIETVKEDYDLVCPSDYMIERMIKANLVKELDTKIINPAEEGLLYGGLLDLTKAYDPDSKYSLPYIWGTFGVMYDSNKVTETVDSWDILFRDTYKGYVYMKDSVRDDYAVAGIYNNRAVLSEKSGSFTTYGTEYKNELNRIFGDTSPEAVAAIKATLTKQNTDKIVKKYEVDYGKDDMITAGDLSGKLGLFWSCDAGYAMGEGDNKDLFYEVPKEGSNVWVDGFVIPKYAKNEKAANYFLKFLCEKEIAKRNMQYVGSTCGIKAAADELEKELIADDGTAEDSFFKGTKEGFKEMYLRMMYPTETILDRCAVMRDFGEMNDALEQMFIEVKAAK